MLSLKAKVSKAVQIVFRLLFFLQIPNFCLSKSKKVFKEFTKSYTRFDGNTFSCTFMVSPLSFSNSLGKYSVYFVKFDKNQALVLLCDVTMRYLRERPSLH